MVSNYHGHVIRRDEEYVGKRVMRMGMDGRREGRQCKGGLEGEGTVRRGDATLGCVEATCQIRRPHIEVGKDAVVVWWKTLVSRRCKTKHP